MQRILRVVVACLIGVTSSLAVACADPEPIPELRLVVEALDHLQLKYTLQENPQRIFVSYNTRKYRDFDGDHELMISVWPSNIAGKPWLTFNIWNLYSIVGCDYPHAARRVLAGAGDKLDTVAAFTYDEGDGTATMRTAIPAPVDRLSPELLDNILQSMVFTADSLEPVMRRAMDSGMIDWQIDDGGPTEPTGKLDCELKGEKIQIGWAPWIEADLFASSIICAGSIIEKFTKWTDVERETFGRELAGSFVGAPARAVYRDWVKGAQYLEQHHPTIAFRFFGPPGIEVTATARVKGLFAGEARASSIIDEMGHVDVDITPEWDVLALAKLNEETSATVEYTVSCGLTTASGRKSIAIQPPSIAELGLPSCIPLAVYVNESHPWVKDLVREAKNLGIAQSLGGATGKFDTAVPQVFAVWQTLRNRGMEYVSIVAAEQADASAQHIRQFHEALIDEGANCADGTALIASVLLSLGYDVHLVTYPGHVFLGLFFGDEEEPAKSVLFVETTMLGSVEEPQSTYLKHYEVAIPAQFHGEEWQLFSAACESGQEQWRQNRCVIASIKALRDAGLSPLPVGAKALGKIPAIPSSVQLAERRKSKKAILAAEFEQRWGWLRDLPAKSPVGYANLAALLQDVEALPRDRKAHARLLGAVDSDEPLGKLFRSQPAALSLLSALNSAARKRFPDYIGDVGTGFWFSSNQVGTSEDRGDGLFVVSIGDPSADDALCTLPVHVVDGRYLIDGSVLSAFLDESLVTASVGTSVLVLAVKLHPEPFKGAIKKLAERVAAGSVDESGLREAVAALVTAVVEKWKESRDAGAKPSGTKQP